MYESSTILKNIVKVKLVLIELVIVSHSAIHFLPSLPLSVNDFSINSKTYLSIA